MIWNYDEADQRVDLRPWRNLGRTGSDGKPEHRAGYGHRGLRSRDFGNDTVTGNGAANDIRGGDGNDSLAGGGGDDTLRGGAGDDVLDGGAGDDDLRGGDGNDTLRGGAGEDWLTGDNDSDTFVFGDDDTVWDFEDRSDMIDISAFGDINADNFGTRVAIRQSDGDVEVQIGEAVLTLYAVSADDITVADFILSP